MTGHQVKLSFSHFWFASAEDVEEVHYLCDHLEQDIKQCLPRSDVVIHVEPCDNKCINCSISCILKDSRPRSPK